MLIYFPVGLVALLESKLNKSCVVGSGVLVRPERHSVGEQDSAPAQ
jgi:hypothetical protein